MQRVDLTFAGGVVSNPDGVPMTIRQQSRVTEARGVEDDLRSRTNLSRLAVVYVYGGSSLKGFGAVRIVLVECYISIIMSFPCFFQYSRSSS